MKLTGLNVDRKKETDVMSVEITTHFTSMEQKLLFHALVMPELAEVLDKYSSVLGILSDCDNYDGGRKDD